MSRPRKTLFTIVALLFWTSSIIGGMVYHYRYETSPGVASTSPEQWPDGSSAPFSSGKVNIIVSLHPRCPCSRASLEALQRLQKHLGDGASIQVQFWMPEGAGPEWRKTDLWQQAASLPNARLCADEGGVEARRFGATTSGHIAIFNADGRRIYSGGLTAVRGRVGNSADIDRICALIEDELPAPLATPVFGCPLSGTVLPCHEGVDSCLMRP